MKNQKKIVSLILVPAALLRAQWESELVMGVNVCEEPAEMKLRLAAPAALGNACEEPRTACWGLSVRTCGQA
jgi:hypothetical protein